MPSNIPADKLLARFEQNENHDAFYRPIARRAWQGYVNSADSPPESAHFSLLYLYPEVADAVDALMAKLRKSVEGVIAGYEE